MAKVFPRIRQIVGAKNAKAAVAGEEFIAAELKGVDVTPENPFVQLDANAILTTVAEDTEVVLRIRRTGLTGTLVEKVTVKPGASAKLTIGLQAEDNPGESANLTYVLTVESVAKKATESEASTLQATY